MQEAVLRIEHMRTELLVRGRWCPVVQDLSLTVRRGETVALVGESGCGKSMTALSVMGLLPRNEGRIADGQVFLGDTELSRLSRDELCHLRGDRMAMIFQEPMTSLNPVMPVGRQVAEALILHRGLSRSEAKARAIEALAEVKIPSASQRYHDYPHQFSGGMRQRVMIALAIACHPALLLADEPTTALDVTIQAEILSLLADLRERHGTGLLFITHNLGVVAQIADRVAVMYAGEIVEEGPVEDIFENPAHPYTRALFSAIPRIDLAEQELALIPGQVPPIGSSYHGCRFRPRCREARAGCEQPQSMRATGPDHRARCLLAGSAQHDEGVSKVSPLLSR